MVYQTRSAGGPLTEREEIIYAEVFWRKSRAEQAVRDRNANIKVIGNRSLGAKRMALLVPLPWSFPPV
jgi:hypothetical protein